MLEVENVGICTGHAFAVEQAASFTDKGSSSTCKNKGVETPTIQLKPIYPMENENRIDLSLFDGNSINEWRQRGAGGNQVYTIHTEADDEKIVAEVYPHDDKFTHLINADLLHHAAELVAELRRMYEREDKLLGWIKEPSQKPRIM